MSQRIDRLARAARAHLDEDEGLLGSVLGRLVDARIHAAVVATDRQVLVVTERMFTPSVRAFRYADITELTRTDAADTIRLDVVGSTGRVSVDRIPRDATARVVVALLLRRAEVAEDRTIRTATAGTPGLRHGVRIRT